MTTQTTQSAGQLDPRLLSILVCPTCKGELSHQTAPEELHCGSCKLAFEVRDGVPIMMVDEARKLD